MARIRTIKPEFCTSADVGALTRDARLFFLQLLTEADDEGRMLWIGRRLAGALYPFDDDVTGADLERWCTECCSRGMLTRYKVADVEYVQVTNWSKHQKISHPAKSRLPGLTDQAVITNPGATPEALAKSSGDIPEGLRPDLGTRKGNREQGKGTGIEEPNGSSRGASAPPADLNAKKAERLKQVTDDAVAAYNATMAKPEGLLPKVAIVNDTRRKQVKRCIGTASAICERVYGSKAITPRFWEAYFAGCAKDDFLAGRAPRNASHANWTPDFEYLTRDDVMTKCIDRVLSPTNDEAAA